MQQLVGLWISYQNHSQSSKSEIIKLKEQYYSELLNMTQLFLASIDSTSVESLYLAQQHDRILEIASKPQEL